MCHYHRSHTPPGGLPQPGGLQGLIILAMPCRLYKDCYYAHTCIHSTLHADCTMTARRILLLPLPPHTCMHWYPQQAPRQHSEPHVHTFCTRRSAPIPVTSPERPAQLSWMSACADIFASTTRATSHTYKSVEAVGRVAAVSPPARRRRCWCMHGGSSKVFQSRHASARHTSAQDLSFRTTQAKCTYTVLHASQPSSE